MPETEGRKLVRDDITYDQPIGVDAVFIYRLRAYRQDFHDEHGLWDVIYTQEYGGNNGQWREYNNYDLLDLDFEGVIKLEGRWLAAIRGQMDHPVARAEVLKIRDTLDVWLNQEGT